MKGHSIVLGVGVTEMEDYASSDDDYHYDSDQDDSVEAYENDEDYALLSSKGPTTKVFPSDRIHPFFLIIPIFNFIFSCLKNPH